MRNEFLAVVFLSVVLAAVSTGGVPVCMAEPRDATRTGCGDFATKPFHLSHQRPR